MDHAKHGRPEETELQPPPKCHAPADFDPCSNAKPCSPFYLYNHDSPRPSTDHKYKPSVSVSIHDLESATEFISPTVSQEKIDSGSKNHHRTQRRRQPGERLAELFLKRGGGQQQCLTKPREKSWLQSLPKRKRILVKLIIAFVIAGCMVGIAVGIAVGLRSGVWKGNNSQGNIGS